MVTRRTLLKGLAATSTTLALAACGTGGQNGTSSDSILFGVSGPFTGDNAEYGKIWKKGFDLALDEINGKGGVKGRKIELVYEDSQADPKQTVPIAQKFVNNKAILAELGDFASPASMAASSIYQRAKLVQFGFTNSHPKFTLGGDYMWSTSITQKFAMSYMAQVAHDTLKTKKQAILYLDTDWGHTSQKIYVDKAQSLGDEIVLANSYLSNEKDFRTLLLKVRDANPDVLVLTSYYNDAALIVQQAKAVGLKSQIFAAGSSYSPRFLSLGGDATNGVILTTNFFPTDPAPEVQTFVKAYQKRYNETPDTFGVGAYDALKILAWAVEKGGASRTGIQQALREGTDIPSVIYGHFSFGPDRRVANVKEYIIQVKDGKFVLYNG